MAEEGHSVLVIGAGPGGLVAAKELKAAGCKVAVYEASGDIGGQWNLNNEMSGVWDTLTMNTIRATVEFSDFEWKKAIPDPFPGTYRTQHAPCTEYKAYLDAYADAFGLRELVQLDTRVLMVSKEDNGKYSVQSKKTGEVSQTVMFDAVAVCSGKYVKPYEPLLGSGGALANFQGQVVHSREFNQVYDKMQGMRVLVVGNNISGGELVTEAVEGGAAQVFHAYKTARYAIRTIAQDGSNVTNEYLRFSRLFLMIRNYLPRDLSAAMMLRVAGTQVDPKVVGEDMAPTPESMRWGITLSKYDYAGQVNSGRVQVVPIPVSSHENTITFQNGRQEEFDIVVLATGYQQHLPFLSESLREDLVSEAHGLEGLQLYKHTLHPSEPGLFFIGHRDIIGAVPPVLEMQARYMAAILAGRVERPDEAAIRADIESKNLEFLSHPGTRFQMQTLMREELAAGMGMQVSIWECLWHPQRRLFAPMFPCEYRTNPAFDDPLTVKAAQERYERYVNTPFVSS